jgi:hypothetical protein
MDIDRLQYGASKAATPMAMNMVGNASAIARRRMVLYTHSLKTMEIYVAATAIGRRRFFIDVSNWERVERRHRPFLVNSGWPEGLAEGVIDISRYMEELAAVYREAVEVAAKSHRDFVKTAARMWPLRFILPMRAEVDQSALRETRDYWEIKTHVENVVGKRLGQWDKVYVGRVNIEARGKAVYVGGKPSLGHTYLYLLGALQI